MSYSQRDEESVILGKLWNAYRPGVFLDIGAFDGHLFSNTLALVERGWSGVLVEPSIKGFDGLLKLHGTNERLKLVQGLVGLETKLTPFWNSDDAVSTTEARHRVSWEPHSTFRPPCYVPQITVRTLLSTFPFLANLDFLSIDTEGTSAKLFLEFPFGLCRAKLVCVEHDNQRKEIENHADALGYRLIHTTEENLIFSYHGH